jgi:hypothetical protein
MNSPELIVDCTADDIVGAIGCSTEMAMQILDASKSLGSRA